MSGYKIILSTLRIVSGVALFFIILVVYYNRNDLLKPVKGPSKSFNVYRHLRFMYYTLLFSIITAVIFNVMVVIGQYFLTAYFCDGINKCKVPSLRELYTFNGIALLWVLIPFITVLLFSSTYSIVYK